MLVLELVFAGFFSAIGWWSANHYVIEPYFEQKTQVEQKKDTMDK